MAPVLITCPRTDELVPTGMEVPKLDQLGDDNLLIARPQCGRDHERAADQAVLSSWGAS